MDKDISIITSASTDQDASGVIYVQDGIPPGFSLLPDGVHLEIAPNDPQWICSPLRVAALFCDQAGKNWGRLVEVQDRHGKWHALPVLDGELSRSAPAILSNLQGAPTRHMVTAERLGWAVEAMTSFVLGGGRAVGPVEVLPVGNALTTLADQIRARGSLDEWRSKVALKCIGNPLLLLAVSSAFAGHLPLSANCPPTAGFLEGAAAARNSMLLVLDELARHVVLHLRRLLTGLTVDPLQAQPRRSPLKKPELGSVPMRPR